MKTRAGSKGFTLIEVLVTVALVGIVMAILMAMQNLFSKETNKFLSRSGSNIDTLVGERVLYLDLRGVGPSFNILKLNDDNGNSFFDYYYDVPESVLPASAQDRIFTLQPGKNVFYILHQDAEAGSMLNYDPVAAYKVGPIPQNYNIAANVSYVSVNNNNWISSQRPNFWQKDKLLLFDTNVYVRASEPLDMAEAPTMPAFLGAVDLQNNQVVETPLSKYLKSNYKNVDSFLRELQPRGGGQPFVKVRSVRFYRYYLQTYQDNRVLGTPSRLFRDEYVDGKFSSPFLISDRVKSVRFSRESVLNKVVRFSIEKLADKNSQEGP